MIEILELRQTIDAGRRYINGKCSIQELHGYASNCWIACKLFRSHPEIARVTEEWMTMTYRRWNEWHDLKNPLTDSEFKQWLSEQIVEDSYFD